MRTHLSDGQLPVFIWVLQREIEVNCLENESRKQKTNLKFDVHLVLINLLRCFRFVHLNCQMIYE